MVGFVCALALLLSFSSSLCLRFSWAHPSSFKSVLDHLLQVSESWPCFHILQYVQSLPHIQQLTLNYFVFFFIFYFFWPCPQHTEIPRPGISTKSLITRPLGNYRFSNFKTSAHFFNFVHVLQVILHTIQFYSYL